MIVAELFAKLGLQVDKSSWAKGNEVLSGMHKALTAFVAVEAIKKLGETAMATIDLGGHLDDLRQKTGLTAESLQLYGFAAKLGGSDMDSFANGVTKFARTLKEAQGGSADASAALHQVGVTGNVLKAALKGGSGLDAAISSIADKFAAMPDGPKKTALAMQLFGKSGAELIPTLNRGSAGLATLKQEARDLGVVMSEDAVNAADELGDNIDKVKMSLTGLKNQAVAALLPMLKEMVDGLIKWIKANRELLVSSISTMVKGLILGLRGLAKAFEWVATAIKYLQEHAELGRAVLIALGVVFGAMAAEAVAAGVAAAAAFALPIAVIAGLVLVVWDVWKAITQGKGITIKVLQWIRSKFFEFGRALRDVFSDIWTGLKRGFKAVFDFVVDLPVVKQLIWLVKKLAGAVSTAAGVISDPKGAAKGVVDSVKSLFSFGHGGTATKPATGPTAMNITNGPINITTPSGDPVAVGQEVRKQIAEHWDSQMVDTHAGVGGGNA